MPYTTSYRPTPYRPQHLGNLYNAFCNWLLAYRSGGDFVFVVDDLCADLGRLWISGYDLAAMVPQYVEELTWMGMAPDRVVWSSSNAERHEWAREKLGYKRAGRWLEMPWAPLNRIQIPLFCQGYDDRPGPPADFEGRLEAPNVALSPQYLAACAVDDIDFGITAWAAGDDLRGLEAWMLDAYAKLGYPAPAFTWHPQLKGEGDPSKLAKSNAAKQTVAALREAGYTPSDILWTLLECEARAYEQGLQCIVIPDGILGLDEVRTLEYHHRLWEQTARGQYHVLDCDPEAYPHIERAVQEHIQKLREGAYELAGSQVAGG